MRNLFPTLDLNRKLIIRNSIPTPQIAMKTTFSNPFLSALLALPIVVALGGSALAQAINKETTGTDLTTGASWVDGFAPGSGNVATWVTGSLGGALTIGSDVNWAGIDIQGATTAITTTGAGILTLQGSGINIASGGVNATLTQSMTLGADQNWTVGTGRTLTVANATGKTLTLGNKLTLNGAGQVNFGGTGSTTLTGAGEIVVSSGILQNNLQSGSSSAGRSGATTLSGGTISIASSINMFGTGAINLNSGAIGSFSGTGRDLGTGNAVNIGGNVQIGGSSGGLGNGYMRFGGAVDLGGSVRTLNVISSSVFASNGAGAIFSGVISNGGITKDGAGILTITNNGNTLTGATTINAGTFVINQKSIANSSSVTINGTGALTITENGAGTHDINNLSGASGATIRTEFTITGTAGARTLRVTQDTNGTYAGSFVEGTSGRTIALVKTGTAKLTMSGTGGYTGGTTISQGTLAAVTNGNALGSTGTVTINDSNTGSNNTALLLGNITMARPITVANQGGGTTTLGANGSADLPEFSGAITLAKAVTLDGTGNTDRLTFSGGIGGTGNVTIAGGTDRVVFAGTAANTYTGTTTISANSILQLGFGSSLATSLIPDASVLTVNSGGFLKLAKGANSETIGGLSGSGTVRGHEGVTGAASALVVDSGASQNFSGVLEDGGASGSTLSLTKQGAGSLTLSGNSTYTGATLVSGGTLLVTGTLGDSAVTVGASGMIGGSGTLGGALTLDDGAKLDLTGASVAFSSTGILTVAAGKSITLSDFAFADIIGWDAVAADPGIYTLINGGGTVTLGGTTPTESNPFDFGNGKSGYFKQGSLQAVVIPEPAAVLLGGLGLLALLRRRR